MPKKSARLMALFLVIMGAFLLFLPQEVYALPEYQIPTGSIPTVTGTAQGAMVTVRTDMGETFLNVRSGPGGMYDKIGVLLAGQSVPALGISPKGEYYLVSYPGVPSGQGWVRASYVILSGGDNLPIVEAPATATPVVTATFDPTLAAQFIVTLEPTRMPTFTEPALLQIPTYTGSSSGTASSGVPMGLVVLILLVAGLLVGVFSMLQER